MRLWWIERAFRGYVGRSQFDQVPFTESIGPLPRYAYFWSARPRFYHKTYLVHADEPRPHNL